MRGGYQIECRCVPKEKVGVSCGDGSYGKRGYGCCDTYNGREIK
jgi:hypothetical protein